LSGTTDLAELTYASIEEYVSTFADAGSAAWRLDSSTPYFQSAFTREQIARLTPSARIVICLREPVARAYSAYNWAVKEGWETAPTFEAALALEAERRDQGYWFSYLYSDTSRYSARVVAWQERFRDCKVVLFDDLCADPLATTNDVLAWLDLEPLAELTASVKNPSGLDRSPIAKGLRRLANRSRNERGPAGRMVRAVLGDLGARRLKQTVVERLDRRLTAPPPLADETRARLAVTFTDDIARLEDLLGRDLSAWRLNRAGFAG
jgi:hypothetical protein